ncbi:hypothetical protein J6590_027566 [Homalodisca vitripennis]|nr:hypothetical protein J6590_027566 [Homalodisca vitripennis]
MVVVEVVGLAAVHLFVQPLESDVIHFSPGSGDIGPPADLRLLLHSCGDSLNTACDCQLIERVDQYKYLGVIIDAKLKWEPHLFIRTVLVYTYSHKDAVLTPIVHSYPTRNAVSVGLQVPLIKLSINLTNAYYVANTLYRHLPSVIRDLQDEPVSGFKRLVTTWLRMIGPDGAEALLSPTYRYQ